MRQESQLGGIVADIGLNVVTVIVAWITAFAMIQVGQRLIGSWPAIESMKVAASAVGLLITLHLRAKAAALFLAGQVAFAASELVLHSVYSIRAVQGAPTHFAVMGAATLGVLLGTFLVPRMTRKPFSESAASLLQCL